MTEPTATPSTATVTGIYAGADLAPGALLAERYRIDGLLGIGGMGVVYRAFDTALNVPVAVKLLRPELAQRPEAFERFRQELLLARQVSSAHVVRIHDIARDGERWFITMDLIEGEALDRKLDREGALPIEQALSIARQLAEGLGAAHARGVVHRDLKPSNVLIDRDGRACIADFGVARSLGSSGLTHSGAIVGTPDYLSPEQARGVNVDARSDLYALGLLLYEMLSGKLPFDAATPSESISQRLSGTPAPLRRARPDAPVWVDALVARLLRTTPSHRFQTAADVVIAIDARRAPFDAWKWRRRGIGGAVTVAIAAAALAAWQWWPQPAVAPAEPPPDRVLVIASTGTDAPQALRLEALADHARIGLQSHVAVVDAERTRQALAQFALPDGGSIKPDALRAELPGARVLRLAYAPDGSRLQAWWQPQAAAESEIALDADPATALAQAMRAVVPDGDFAGFAPSTPESLDAYGNGLRLRLQGKLDEAQQAFAAALAAAPTDDVAALALAETAWLAGDRATAASTAKRRVAASLQARFDAMAAFFEDDIERAAALLQARVATSPDDLATALQLATVQGDGGDLAAAIATLRSIVRRDPGEPRAWFALGKYSILRGEFRAAVDEYLVRALVLFKRGRNAYGEAETINALGVGYARLGQMEDAQEQYRKAVELRGAIGNRRGVASSLRNLAQIATIRGEHDAAAKYLEEARALFEALDDRSGLAAIDNELGLLAEERGDYAAALDAYRRALRGREAIDDAFGSAESLNNIGFAHYQLGDYDSAQVYWRQADQAFTKLQDLNGHARTRQNLGLLEISRGRWDAARKLLAESLETAESQQMAEEAAVTRRNLAELDILQGDTARALEQLAHAQALFTERDDRRGLADAALLRARVHLAAADASGAKSVLDGAAGLLAEASSEQKAIAAIQRAAILRLEGDAAAAQAALAEAETLATQAGVRALQLQVRVERDDVAADLDEALRALGNRPLLLARCEAALARGSLSDDAAAAQYREALQWLQETGAFARGWRIHQLGAEALRRSGDAQAAGVAEAAARDELARVIAAAPEALRAPLQKAVAADGP